MIKIILLSIYNFYIIIVTVLKVGFDSCIWTLYEQTTVKFSQDKIWYLTVMEVIVTIVTCHKQTINHNMLPVAGDNLH